MKQRDLFCTTLEIMKFKNRIDAKNYLKFQRDNGNSMQGAHVRMRKCLGHKWANHMGNVAVIKTGSDPGGDIYLFSNGISNYEYLNK